MILAPRAESGSAISLARRTGCGCGRRLGLALRVFGPGVFGAPPRSFGRGFGRDHRFYGRKSAFGLQPILLSRPGGAAALFPYVVGQFSNCPIITLHGDTVIGVSASR